MTNEAIVEELVLLQVDNRRKTLKHHEVEHQVVVLLKKGRPPLKGQIVYDIKELLISL